MRQTLARVLDDLGRRLAELRRARGWTQAEVAERLGMLPRDYQAIEGGERAITIRSALTIAQVFEVPLHEMFMPPASREPRRPGRPTGPVVAQDRGLTSAGKPKKRRR